MICRYQQQFIKALKSSHCEVVQIKINKPLISNPELLSIDYLPWHDVRTSMIIQQVQGKEPNHGQPAMKAHNKETQDNLEPKSCWEHRDFSLIYKKIRSLTLPLQLKHAFFNWQLEILVLSPGPWWKRKLSPDGMKRKQIQIHR